MLFPARIHRGHDVSPVEPAWSPRPQRRGASIHAEATSIINSLLPFVLAGCILKMLLLLTHLGLPNATTARSATNPVMLQFSDCKTTYPPPPVHIRLILLARLVSCGMQSKPARVLLQPLITTLLSQPSTALLFIHQTLRVAHLFPFRNFLRLHALPGRCDGQAGAVCQPTGPAAVPDSVVVIVVVIVIVRR